jgi:hypothetical protein
MWKFLGGRDPRLAIMGSEDDQSFGSIPVRPDRCRRVDVLHLRYIEQTECFMFLLKCPIDGPSSTLTGCRKRSKTVDATHPYQLFN